MSLVAAPAALSLASGNVVSPGAPTPSPLSVAAQWLVVCVVAALVYWAVSLRVYRKRAKQPAADRGTLFVALVFVAFAGSTLVIADSFAVSEPLYFLPIAGFFLLFFYLFSDRRYAPGWTRYLVFVYGLTQIGTLSPSKQPNPQADQFMAQWHVVFDVLALVGNLAVVMLVVIGIVPQVYARYARYRRLREIGAEPLHYPRRTWGVLVAGMVVASFVLLVVAVLFTQSPPRAPSVVYLCARTGYFLLTTLIPVALGFALTRGQLLDRDALTNRVLVYGALSLSLLVIFCATTALQFLIPGLLTYPFIYVFVLLVAPFLAMLFRPLRAQVQERIDQHFFRRRYEAGRVIAAAGETLRGEAHLDRLSAGLVAGTQKALRPSAVALWLRATAGVPTPRAAGWLAAPLAAPIAQTRQRSNADGEIRLHRRAGATANEAAAPALFDVALNEPLRAALARAAGGAEIARLPDAPATRAWREAGTSLALPLVSQGELIGVVTLGSPTDAIPYTVDERELLATFADATAPALRVAQWEHEQDVLTRERERVEQELQTARRIQEALLPKTVPTLDGWQIATMYQPAREVGGDFYDFLLLPDGKLGLVLGDVTDKGMPAALVMATTRSMLRAVGTQHAFTPGRVLAQVNELLCPDLPASMFVTCFYAILDPTTGRMRYANAGQDLPCLRHVDGSVGELRATGMPLGLMPGMVYEEQEVTLAHSDSVLFYSDGLVEAHNPQREMFGFPRLMSLLGESPDGMPPILTLLHALASFTGAEWEQEDDITLVTLHRLPGADATGSQDAAESLERPAVVTTSVAQA